MCRVQLAVLFMVKVASLGVWREGSGFSCGCGFGVRAIRASQPKP